MTSKCLAMLTLYQCNRSEILIVLNLFLGSVIFSVLLILPSLFVFKKANYAIKYVWAYVLLPVVEWWALYLLGVFSPLFFNIIELPIIVLTTSATVFLFSILTLRLDHQALSKWKPLLWTILLLSPVVLRYFYPPISE